MLPLNYHDSATRLTNSVFFFNHVTASGMYSNSGSKTFNILFCENIKCVVQYPKKQYNPRFFLYISRNLLLVTFVFVYYKMLSYNTTKV